MINRKEAFALLGIKPTSDQKAIKKAYAAKVKEYHPEEHPDAWAKIREAYEAALKYSRFPEGRAFPSEREDSRGSFSLHSFPTGEKEKAQAGTEQRPDEEEKAQAGTEQRPDEEEKTQAGTEQAELLESFDQLDRLIQEGKQKNKALYQVWIQEAINRLKEMGEEKIVDPSLWEDFFRSLTKEVFSDIEFHLQWGKTIGELPLTAELARLMESWITYAEKETEKQLYYPRAKLMEQSSVSQGDDGLGKGKNRNGLLFGIKMAIYIFLFILASVWKADRREKDSWEKYREDIREEQYSYLEDFRDSQYFQPETVRFSTLSESDLNELGIMTKPVEEEETTGEGWKFSDELWQIHQKLIADYYVQDEEEKESLQQRIVSGIKIRDGVYLCGEGDISETEIIWEEILPDYQSDVIQMSSEEIFFSVRTYYTIDLWAEKSGGIYVLYIDPSKVDLEMNCKVFNNYKEMPLYTSSKGKDITREYHYKIAGYKAIVVEIPENEAEPCRVYFD
ncbi:MAG: DnaJ domain-containing protein [Lachnospiraceae bacterium]|nr:DnaJ domain-containing protein [Lachnospiraceae bacterium]